MNRMNRTKRGIVSAAGLARAAGRAPGRRRGVVAVVAMMFLVMFGSLAAAMAITSKGNIKTASTHVHVMRALGAAETGMAVAEARLKEAASRFIVGNSTINATTASGAWEGNLSAFGTATILPPAGFSETGLPFGVAEAVANRHAADQNVVSSLGFVTPVVGNAMSGVALPELLATRRLLHNSPNSQAPARVAAR